MDNQIDHVRDQAKRAVDVFRGGARRLIEGGVKQEAVLLALLEVASAEMASQRGVHYAAEWLRDAANVIEQNENASQH